VDRNHRGRRRAAAALTAGALVAGVLALTPGSPAGATTLPYRVIASGLDNPRHLALGRFGGVYVAEAGRGGDHCVEGTDPETGEPTELCAGATGAVTRISGGGIAHRVLTGLPSLAGPDGSSATGPHDVTTKEGIHVLVGRGGNVPEALLGDLQGLGTLQRRVTGIDETTFVADLQAFEDANNPDGGILESNPYGLWTSPRGDHYVADAGGNSLLAVDRQGGISLRSVFPGGEALAPPFLGLPPGARIPFEPVPTSVDVGPDGLAYVSQLTGFPFPLDQAKVFRVGRFGVPSWYAGGFTNVVDLAFGPDGSLYVLELASQGLLTETEGPPVGALYRILPDGRTKQLLSGPELVAPGGVAVNGQGDVFVTINSILPGAGAVLKYQHQ